MSIIAVEKKDKEITFVADTQMTYCDEVMKTKKLFETNKFVFGIASDNQPHLSFKAFLEDYEIKSKTGLTNVKDIYDLIINFSAQQIPESLKFAKDDQLLIADKNTKKVFSINPHSMTCYEVAEFEAIGAGANYAIGAYDAGASIEEAVKVACKRNIYCSEPLSIINITS